MHRRVQAAPAKDNILRGMWRRRRHTTAVRRAGLVMCSRNQPILSLSLIRRCGMRKNAGRLNE